VRQIWCVPVMNLAFPALLVFLFLLPGLFFTLAFYKTESKPLNYIPLTHKAAVSFFVTFLVHFLWISLISVTAFKINFSKLLILFSGAQGNIYATTISSISLSDIVATSIYLLTIYSFAYFLGWFFRQAIRWFKLDKKLKMLRLDSPWYYLFTGYDWEEGKPDIVLISSVMELAGKGYIYLGYLDGFFLDDEGNIDRLVLTGAMRRDIEKDKISLDENQTNEIVSDNGKNSLEQRFYPIDGNYFVIKYSEIKNLNILFIKLEEIDP
jgi:hypothetical protein